MTMSKILSSECQVYTKSQDKTNNIIVVVIRLVGNYTCEVEWRGQPMQISHQLVVLVPPTIEAVLPHHIAHGSHGGSGGGQLQLPVEARLGTSVKLECRADGIPTPVIRWRRPQVGQKKITFDIRLVSYTHTKSEANCLHQSNTLVNNSRLSRQFNMSFIFSHSCLMRRRDSNYQMARRRTRNR